MANNTGNPIGSTAAKDLSDNAENLDKFANGEDYEYADRLGRSRKSLKWIEDAALAIPAIDAAVRSEQQAERALSAKSEAEAARDAAQLSGGVYPDEAAGLASTPDDRFFSVPSPQSTEYLILYQNVSGVAVEVDRYPNAKAIDDVAKLVNDPWAPSWLASAEVDASGSIVAYVKTSGARVDATDVRLYPDEPTGRAAVANGVAFRVQGAGDVAAYEYRRVNSASSTLIATYAAAASVVAAPTYLNDPWAPSWLASAEVDASGSIVAYVKTSGARVDATDVRLYPDEPTGRAAVANGVAFRVQGAGDVAAYEYRRVNSASSTLIATYAAAASVVAAPTYLNDPWAPSWLASVEAAENGDVIAYVRRNGARVDSTTASGGGTPPRSTSAIKRLVRGILNAQSTAKALGEAAPVLGAPQSSVIAGYPTAWNISAKPSLFNVVGGAAYYPVIGSVSTAAGVQSRPPYTAGSGVNRGGFEFVTDAPALVVHTSYTSSMASYHVYVDDVFVGTQVGTSGEHNYWTLTFPNRRVRKILLRPDTGNYNGFFGVYTSALDRVAAPPTPQNLRVVWSGDSYCEGAAAGVWINAYAALVSRQLGFRDAWNVAMGGTGLLKKGLAGDRPNYRERIADIVAANPDLLIFNFSVNDSDQVASALATELTTYLLALRTALPDMWILISGVAAASLGPTQNVIDGESACAAAIATLGDPKIAFVPVSTDTAGPWIFGTGRIGATNGSGNSDFYISSDGTHPGPDGYAYLTARLAEAFKTQIFKWSNSL